MNGTEYIWMDGKFVPWNDAKVHVLTHTLHYGMGIFEGIRFYETRDCPAIFRLKDHVNRFFEGAKDALLEIPFTREEIYQAIIDTVKKNKVPSGYIRPLVYFGYAKMGLNPRGCPTRVAIAAWPWGSYLGEESVTVKTSCFQRIHPSTTHVEAKICGHYVNSMHASCDARDHGYNEALLLDHEGKVAEGPGENIFIIKEGILKTPPGGAILCGITRLSITTIANDEGYEVKESPLTLHDVYNADEAFFTGTAAEVTPIKSLDDRTIGTEVPGPITKKLKQIYDDSVRGKNEKYKDWLTFVK